MRRTLPKLMPLLAACLMWAAPTALVQAQTLKAGAGGLAQATRGGDVSPPPVMPRGAALASRAVPTNQWYSALLFSAQPEVLYAQPLTVKASTAGLEVALPTRQVIPTERRDVEIAYPHRDPITIAPTAFAPGQVRLEQASDWAIDIALAQGPDQLLATVAHGSPYVHAQVSRGDLTIQLPAAGTRLPSDDPRTLLIETKGQRWALFGPSGVQWQATSPTEWRAQLPAGKGYLAAAPLPDAQPATLALLQRHAYARLQDTRASWQVQAATSQVSTTFHTTVQHLEGPDVGPLLALYPHHWFDNPAVANKLGPSYDTVRGPLRLLAASSFTMARPYHGFVPWWPAVADHPRLPELRELMKTDQRNARRMMLEIGTGPYWQGKGLQRITKLLDVVEQQGDTAGRDALLALLKKRIEDWFSGDSNKTYFHLDKRLGTVVAYPEEYFAVQQMNDHHFHYGYWIRAAAEIALRDPAWASRDKWGAMVDWLVADIATTERGRADFPFLRNFDVYEGHSWASGISLGPHGNNQESSSEALNTWAGLILWGEVTGNPALRELGQYLFSSEADAVRHYWFDQQHLVFAPEYKAVEASMVFGGKYAHNTWWTDEPRQIKGINLLPMTTASTHLARDPAFIQRSLATLPADTAVFASRGKRADPPDIWQDIFIKYQALADPAAALAAWDRWGSVELGDTRSHALHWLISLQQMGTPDLSVTADTALYAVFKRADGQSLHLAFNAGQQPITVRFSDGVTLQVPAGSLASSR